METVGLIDTHLHLDMDAFESDREAVLARAWDKGLLAMVTIGVGETIERTTKALALAASQDRIFATVGIHPHDARHADTLMLSSINELASHPKVVGIGEIGLDYHYLNSPKESQRAVFEELLRIATKVQKPIVIHARDAYEDMKAVLGREGNSVVGGVVHCFSGDYSLARWCLDRGFYLSFTGIITFPAAEKERDVIRRIPLERILVETDAPFLTPVPHRGKRNEPAFVVYVVQEIARIKAQRMEEVARITTENARKLFNLPI